MLRFDSASSRANSVAQLACLLAGLLAACAGNPPDMASADASMTSGDSSTGTSEHDAAPDRGNTVSTDGCERATDCGSCTMLRGCGWCDDRCVSGSESGPASGVCAAWDWDPRACSAVSSRDAGTATQDTGASSRDAGSSTPDTGTVDSNDPCFIGDTCDGCTLMPSCGWCDGRCVSGTGSGPNVGACGTWDWFSTDCPSSGPTSDAGSTGNDPCAENSNCTDCTLAGSCGWCDGRCVAAGFWGPSEGSCSDWTDTWTQCSAPEDAGTGSDTDAGADSGTSTVSCSTGSDCASCAAMNGCEWCGDSNSSGQCLSVDAYCAGSMWHGSVQACPVVGHCSWSTTTACLDYLPTGYTPTTAADTCTSSYGWYSDGACTTTDRVARCGHLNASGEEDAVYSYYTGFSAQTVMDYCNSHGGVYYDN